MTLPPTTGALTVNAAFLQEIKEVNLDLWRLLDDLGRRAGRPSDAQGQWPAVVLLFEELRDQLALHFALEEAYGYFEDPVYVAPRLCEQAYALRAEHRVLYVQISDLADLAAQTLGQQTNEQRVSRVFGKFWEFDARLRRHEAAENELIFREYDDDIGVGD